MGIGASVCRGAWVSGVLGFAVFAAGAQDLPAPAERIQRQAENPMRWIIEAGKLKTRPKVVEPAAPNRLAAAKPAARAPVARPPERAAAVSQAASVAAPAVVADVGIPAAAAEPVAAEAPAAAAPVTLELLDGAEPSLPDDVDTGLDSDVVVELALLVMPDGTVSKVSTIASSHPAVDAHAIAAVRQWRFKPVPQMLVHHVELVFHPRR